MVRTVPQAEHVAPFVDLPDELKRMVRALTAASFVVDDKDYTNSGNDELGLVPVIVRYEFRRRLLQASGPEIMARFTRFLDPEFKLESRWRDAGDDVQASVEKKVYLQESCKPFSELKVVREGMWGKFYLVRKVADGTGNARDVVEGTPCWCKFPWAMVAEVREKMDRVFGMTLGEESVKSLLRVG
jgi:hypothetical protein